MTINVPHCEARQVEIRFEKKAPRTPRIYADDGKSPHRYEDDSLCVWHPGDGVENRWVFEDGLLHLLGLIEAHLFREAWWRETGEWLGPEAPHGRSQKARMREEARDG